MELKSKRQWTSCFIGTEAEGKDKGELTLFVPGSTRPEVFSEVMKKAIQKGVSRVYYGAGYDWTVRQKTLDLILREVSVTAIVVEVDVTDPCSMVTAASLVENLDVELVLFCPVESKDRIALKWHEGEDIIVCDLKGTHVTLFSSKDFEGDEEL